MIKYESLVAALVFTMAAHVAAAGQLQPFNVQTQFGASQVALTERQGDFNVVFGVQVPGTGSSDPVITDSTGQEYVEKQRFGQLIAFVAPNVKAGYHLIQMTGVSKLVAIEYKGVTWARGWGGCYISLPMPDSDSFTYPVGFGCWKGELLVWAQIVNTPSAWIAPSLNTEVYDQMGTFVVKDVIATDEPICLFPEVLLTDQKNAEVTLVSLTLR